MSNCICCLSLLNYEGSCALVIVRRSSNSLPFGYYYLSDLEEQDDDGATAAKKETTEETLTEIEQVMETELEQELQDEFGGVEGLDDDLNEVFEVDPTENTDDDDAEGGDDGGLEGVYSNTNSELPMIDPMMTMDLTSYNPVEGGGEGEGIMATINEAGMALAANATLGASEGVARVEDSSETGSPKEVESESLIDIEVERTSNTTDAAVIATTAKSQENVVSVEAAVEDDDDDVEPSNSGSESEPVEVPPPDDDDDGPTSIPPPPAAAKTTVCQDDPSFHYGLDEWKTCENYLSDDDKREKRCENTSGAVDENNVELLISDFCKKTCGGCDEAEVAGGGTTLPDERGGDDDTGTEDEGISASAPFESVSAVNTTTPVDSIGSVEGKDTTTKGTTPADSITYAVSKETLSTPAPVGKTTPAPSEPKATPAPTEPTVTSAPTLVTNSPTRHPTEKPTVAYIEPSDDALDPVVSEQNTIDSEAFANGEALPHNSNDEVPLPSAGGDGGDDGDFFSDEEEVKKVGGWLGFASIVLMIYTAYQMSENPDGVCARYVKTASLLYDRFLPRCRPFTSSCFICDQFMPTSYHSHRLRHQDHPHTVQIHFGRRAIKQWPL